MYVISGLRDGYVAMYTKIHHALIDGVSGAEITGLLLDLTAGRFRCRSPGRADGRPGSTSP